MFKKLYFILAIACREATLLMEKKQQVGKLAWHEKAALRFHLTICDGCRRFNKQNDFLTSILHKSMSAEINDFSKMRLADDAKIRIQQSIHDKLNNI